MVNLWGSCRVLLVSLTALMIVVAGVPQPVCACAGTAEVAGQVRTPGSCPCQCEANVATEPTAPEQPAPEKKTGCCCQPAATGENSQPGTKSSQSDAGKEPGPQLAKKPCVKSLSAALAYTPGATPASASSSTFAALLPALPAVAVALMADPSLVLGGCSLCLTPPPNLLLLLQHFLI